MANAKLPNRPGFALLLLPPLRWEARLGGPYLALSCIQTQL